MKKRKLLQFTAGALALSMALAPLSTAKVKAATEHWNDASEASTDWENYKANWEQIRSNYQHVSLTPGKNESELNFAWYSKTQEVPKVRISTKEDMTNATVAEGKGQAITGIEELAEYYSNKVTLTGLKENTQYYYQVFQNGEWQETKKYKTNSFHDYSFLYVGDPQIGASKGQTSSENEEMTKNGEYLAARNDSYNWEQVLNNAMANHPDVSFMVSAGDQVNTASCEQEYAGYLGASALASLPVATTIGNHDSGSNQYSLHYNNPNTFSGDETYTKGATKAGTDYYYTYGDVLFIVLDTNNYNCATHENVIKKAVEENKDAKWRIVTFHQDIYGSGLDHSDSDGIILRTQLTPLFDKYDVDVVLQGHDHTYSRTYQLTSDGKTHASYDNTNVSDVEAETYLKENNCYNITSDTVTGTVVNPEGTVYLEANSATGSKFYNLIASQQDYIAERSQTWRPSYSVINVSESSLSVSVYDAKTGAMMEGSSTYTIVKEADKTTLKNDIKSAQDKIKDEHKYTQKSLKALEDAMEKANQVANDKKTKKQEVQEQASNLANAVAGLKAKVAQTITGTESYNKTLSDKAFALEVKNSGKGELTYTSSDENVAVVSKDGIVRLTGAGNADITITANATEDELESSKVVKLNVTEATTQAAATTQATATTQTVATTQTAATTQAAATTEKSQKHTKQIKVKKVTGVKLGLSKGNAINVTYKKNTKAAGYEIYCAKNKTFTKDVNIYTTKKDVTKKAIKNLTKNQEYYVKVRAYQTSDGEKVYGNFSKVQKLKVK